MTVDMPDLLLSGPHAIHVDAAEGSRPPLLSPAKSPRKQRCRGDDYSPVTRLVEGASSLALALRDGLSGPERAKRWRDADRRQILLCRMLNVSIHTPPLGPRPMAAPLTQCAPGRDPQRVGGIRH